jgi:hypothetical protein
LLAVGCLRGDELEYALFGAMCPRDVRTTSARARLLL